MPPKRTHQSRVMADDDNRRSLKAFAASIDRDTGLMLFITQGKAEELRQAFVDEEVFPNDFVCQGEKCGGMTLMHLCTTNRQLECLKVLLEFGCDPDPEEKNMNYTPLFFTAIARDDFHNERYEIAKTLIEYGADVFHKDKMGGTVIDRARPVLAAANDNRIMELIKGAALDAVRRDEQKAEQQQQEQQPEQVVVDNRQQHENNNNNNNNNFLDPNMTQSSFAANMVTPTVSINPATVQINNPSTALIGGVPVSEIDNRQLQQQAQNQEPNRIVQPQYTQYPGPGSFQIPQNRDFSPKNLAGNTSAPSQSKRTQMISAVTILAAVSRNQISELEEYNDFVDKEFLDFGHQGMPFLYYAATTGSIDALRWLLRHGCEINYRGPRGETALHQAIMAGSKDVAMELVERGADLSCRAYDEKTCYVLAARAYNFGPVAAVMLQKLTNGAISTPSEVPDFVLSIIKSQNTRVMKALYDCDVITKDFLMSPHPTANVYYIHVACHEGKADALRELLELTDRKALDQQNHIGNTPCHVAVKNRQIACVQILTEANCNMEIRNGSGETVTDCAIRGRDNAIINIIEAAWKKFVRSGRASTSGSQNSGNQQMMMNRFGGGSGNNNNNNMMMNASSSEDNTFLGGMGAPQMSSLMVQNSLSIQLDELTAAYLSRFPQQMLIQTNDVELKQHIASGGGGSVHLAKIKSLDRLVAAKIFRDADSIRKAIEECERSIRLHHPNIVQTVGLTVSKSQFSTDLVLLMELGEGTLQDVIRSGQGPTQFDFDTTYSYMKQVAQGLAYLHQKNMLWLDGKPGNLLLFENKSKVKLCDFGLGREIDRDKTHDTVSRAGAGTLKFMSKAQLNEEQVRPVDDVYSYGATFYTLVCGVEPWSTSTMVQIMSGNLIDHFEPRQGCPETLINVVKRCLAVEPNERPQNGREVLRLLIPEDEEMPNTTSMPTTVSTGTEEGGTSQMEAGTSEDVTEQINFDMTY